VLVVGAGITGLTIAERCAAHGQRVLVVDRRSHFGGNCYDERDEHGCLVHRYGPHIFHTGSHLVAEYLSQFTDWRPYEHRVVAQVGDKLVPVPVNATTLEMLHVCAFHDEEAVRKFLDDVKVDYAARPANSKELVLSQMGERVYEAIFRPYTQKQWGRDPSELDRSVCGRIPVRTNRDDRYFTDDFQNMPAEGYTAMFDRMIESPLIDVKLEVDGREAMYGYRGVIVWTGPIDELFGEPTLPWRSVTFELTHSSERQPAAVINRPSEDVPYTRSTDYSWLTGQKGPVTAIHREYAKADGEPYYPVPSEGANALAMEYRKLVDELRENGTPIVVCGRLGRYQYLEMGQAVGSALKTFCAHRGRLLAPV
jgi:UDP-galactopyranose mutase